MPALFMSGWNDGRHRCRRRPRRAAAAPPPLPPNRPLSLRLKSRHNSSRSGGPSLRLLIDQRHRRRRARRCGARRSSAAKQARAARPNAVTRASGTEASGSKRRVMHAGRGEFGHGRRGLRRSTHWRLCRQREMWGTAPAFKLRQSLLRQSRRRSGSSPRPCAGADEDARRAHARRRARRRRAAHARPARRLEQVEFVETSTCGIRSAPISASTRSTSALCSAAAGWPHRRHAAAGRRRPFPAAWRERRRPACAAGRG